MSEPGTYSPAADLALIDEMRIRGAHAATQGGWHLTIWGLAAAAALLVQYVAEVRDVAPSRVLWWWQPIFLLGGLLSLRALFRYPGGRPRDNAITRIYIAVFAGVFVALFAYLIGSAIGTGGPVPHTLVLLIAAGLGCAFSVLAAASGLRVLGFAGAGWWLLLVWFAVRGRLVPSDFFMLAAAMLLLVAAPGAALRTWRTSPRAEEALGEA